MAEMVLLVECGGRQGIDFVEAAKPFRWSFGRKY